MAFELWKHVTPAVGETIVRTYHCSRVRSFLTGFQGEGYLSVTSRHVIYRVLGDDTDVIQSDLPLSEISGMSFYRGRYFSVLHLIAAILFFLAVDAILYVLLTAIGGAPYYTVQLVLAVSSLAVAIYLVVQQKTVSFLFPLFANLAAACFSFTVAGSLLTIFSESSGFSGFMNFLDGGNGLLFVISPLAFFFYLFALVKFCIRPAFSFDIQSKMGGGMRVSGLKQSGMAALHSRTVGMEPGWDVTAIVRDLPAMIADLQTGGAAAIDRWRQ